MKLRPEEVKAARGYSGALYKEINEPLRNDDHLSEAAQAAIGHLDAAIAKSRLGNELFVYRGVDEGYASELESRGFREGQIITDKGFLSTSTRKAIAEGFLGESGGGLLLKIRIPEGGNALRMRPYSESPGEDEILLGRGVDLRVIAYDHAADALELELIT